MTTPGFTAHLALNRHGGRFPALGSSANQAGDGAAISPAAIIVWTGHCGCPADVAFGLPCVCYDFVPDPPVIVPDPRAGPPYP